MAGMNSEQARRRVRIAQFAGVALAVAAAALWVLGMPGLRGNLPAKPVVASGQGPGETVAIHPVSIASDAPVGIADRLEIAANRPPKEQDVPTQPDQPVREVGQSSQWKYLGPIFEATRTLALVTLEGKQRIVSEGAIVKIKTAAAEGRPESVSYQATVKKIEPEYLEIDEGGNLVRIDIEARSQKVTWVKNMPTTVAGVNANGANAALTAEARARLAQAGIDPQQIERARAAAAMANGRNRGVPDGNNNNGNPAFAPGGGGRVVDVTRGNIDSPAGTKAVPMSDVDSELANRKQRQRNGAGAVN